MKTFLQSSHVLIIDDEEDVRDLLKNIFEDKGAKVHLSVNGHEGFQSMMNAHFDIVLLDLFMPEMDGFQAIKAIRQVDPIIPIIVITGFATQDNIKKCFDMGANDYFSKPFDINQITKRADELVQEKLESDSV